MNDKLLKQPPSKWFKKESRFTTWRGKHIKEQGGFFHKISDIDMRTKPFDCIVAFEGKCYWVEVKVVRTYSCKPFHLLRWSSSKNPWGQVKGLQTYNDNWWSSLVVVYCTKTNTYKIFNFDDIDLDTKHTFIC